MSTLPTEGTIRYGIPPFDFPVETRTESVRATPVADAAGRTVKYTVFSITVRTWLSGMTEVEMLSIRRRLQKYGQPLVFNAKGFGDLSINTGSTAPQDVVWGPKPTELSWRPLGGGNACELVWNVEVAIPDCADARFLFQAMEFVSGASYQVDSAGYTQRTISGKLAIPGGRAGDGRQLRDSVDSYREAITPPLIPGFHRSFGPWGINEAKTELSFSVVDTEMGDNFPPEWVSGIDASQTVSSTARGLQRWVGTISANYELARGAPDKFTPWKHFFNVLVKDRINAIARSLGVDAKGVLPIGMSIGEPNIYEGYGKPRRATFSYTFTFTRSLRELMLATGFFRPVPGSNWAKWVISLENSAINPYGYARLHILPSDDRITDLCDTGVPALPLPGALRGPPLFGRNANAQDARTAAESVAPTPDPNTSWVLWECSLHIEVESGATAVRTLPADIPTSATDVFGGSKDFVGPGVGLWAGSSALLGQAPAGPAGSGGSGGVFNPPPPPAKPKTIEPVDTNPQGLAPKTIEPVDTNPQVSRRAAPACYVFLKGKAARVGFAVTPPRLLDVNGVEAVPANRLDAGEGFFPANDFTAGNQPLFKAWWNFRYALASVPKGDLPAIPNPMDF